MGRKLSANELPHITFFGDSSSRDKDFMVAGGFAVAGSRINEVEGYIAGLRDGAGILSEFHWSKFRGSRKRKKAYEQLIDYGFSLVEERKAALHIIISKFKGYDHKAKDGENRDTSINRMYYQICLHRLGQLYGKKRAIHVRLDAGNDSSDICNMRNQVCADAYKKFDTRPNCIRSIEPLCSTKSGIIQMADVIIGGIAAKMNNVPHKSAKGPLADYILAASGRPAWDVATPKDGPQYFTVWPLGKEKW